ncbi:MAG: hypothetical protein ACLP50_02890 [Solirubrobacteraceae bacterium]
MSSHIHRHALGLTWLEADTMARAAHALVSGDRVWLIDPYEDAAALGAADELGRPVAVIQLLDRHKRDCESIARRLEVPWLRLPASVPDSPFRAFPVVSRRWWQEVGLWWEQERALIVAEAVGTGPAFALGRPVGVHPLLRLTPPRALGAYRAERLLVGHGEPIETAATAPLDEALAASRSDIPKLLATLPSLLLRR